MKLKRQVFSYPYIVWMLIFILVPMLLIVLFAFRSDEGLTLGNITSVLSNEIYMEVLGRSIWIALKATAICLILGYPIAYILSTMNKRKAAILYVLFIVPMWMNFLLRTYAWQVLLDSNGVLNTLLELLGLPSQQILYTEGAVMLGTVYNFLPFMVLPIYSVLVKLDRSLTVEITSSEETRSFMQSIVYACHKFGKKVCVEGVETIEEFRVVQRMECDFVQGFYFYRPMELPDLNLLLEQTTQTTVTK